MASDNLREVSVQNLVFGMYVSKLDRPWTETPFMFQGFTLNNEKQLNALKKYCKKVYVDPEKWMPTEPPESTGPADAASAAKNDAIAAQLAEKIRGNTVYRQVATVEEEMPKAAKAFARSTEVVRMLASTVRAGGVLDGEQTTEAVKDVTASVERNPDAMILLAKMREQSRETLNRSLEVSVLMIAFGRFLQLPRNQLELLGMCGLLQDAGMLKLPKGIAEKRSNLAPGDREIFRSHIAHSVEILSKTPGLPAELPGIASLHHERYDGSGYPRGLRASAIPLLGQIAAIVDTFDMLTALEPYGEHLSPSAALNVLYRNRGTKFHAGAVEQFIQCLGAFPVGSIVELNSGEIGVVIAQNMVRRLQPRIMVVQDAEGNPINPHKVLDLMNEPMATADEPYRIRRTLEADTIRIDPRALFL
jgi:HD-GYP domain-containing protein (c-di-GMP phosphodiesterase class II)